MHNRGKPTGSHDFKESYAKDSDKHQHIHEEWKYLECFAITRGIPRFIYRFGHHNFSDAIALLINQIYHMKFI